MMKSARASIVLATLVVALYGLVNQAYSATREDVFRVLGGLTDNWPEAGLQGWINDDPADSDPTVTLGDSVSYSFQAQAPGYVSLVHVDSHGTTSLIFPRTSGYPEAPIADTYPSSGILKQSSPLGKETVYVVLTEQPVDPAVVGAASGMNFVTSEDSVGLAKRYLAAVSEAGKASKVALTRFQYFVEAKPGTTEHNTRAIQLVLLQDMKPDGSQEKWEGVSEKIRRKWPDRIQFDLGSAELKPEGKIQLDVWGEVLADKRIDHAVILVGHTDDLGDERYNLDLSRRRGLAARNYLVENFPVDPSRVEVQWRGESDPLVPNTNKSARAQNRRVEFVFVKN